MQGDVVVGRHAPKVTGALERELPAEMNRATFGSMAEPTKRIVTNEHKAAMAEGRTQSRAISAYLDALETHRPKRGRKRTSESIGKRLATIDKELASAKAIKRLSLVQERLELLEEQGSLGAAVDLSDVEAAFVSAAKDYGDRKGISYAAWRELGVSAAVLKRAGIGRAG
jgi:hypothetical protein